MFEPDIIGLGLANVDLVIRLEEMPRWENPGVVSGFALADGGPAGTACAVAAMLDAKMGFIDTFGNDEIAAIKLRSLEQAGVDVSRMDVLFKFGLIVGPIVGCLFIVPFAISRLFTVSRAKHAEIKQALLERKQGTPKPEAEQQM